MTEKENILEVRNVVKDYFRLRAVDRLSFNLEKGKILGLLGPNGSGKSTTLKLIAGLLKLTSGEIRVLGHRSGKTVKTDIAYLPEIDYLYPWMTVKQIIEFVAPFYKDWDMKKSEELIGYLKLDRSLMIKKLSKGMRAKLKILMVLSRNAPLILMDEPFSGIDYPTRSKLIEAIVNQFREDKQSIILSTHEVPETEGIFDEVIFLEGGSIKLSGSADGIREKYDMSISELLKEVYPA